MTDSSFELVKEQHIAELNTRARLYRHTRTGAEVLSLENDDENKSFGIAFRTPPSDATGVAHILEHSVLNGSAKYPVKEPFTQMVKGSLRTFLNAITFSDKTAYPVASQNLQDFYNLVDVYFDAVFHPLLARETLAQEGWHYELPSLDSQLAYKGVVFNEMKGAYSSPDGALYHYAQQTIFPDNQYRFDSGGDPKHIPDLTYEQFVEFHRKYYHPSNARIVFYGDDDPEERLRRTAAVLDDYDTHPVDGLVDLQPRFSEPRQHAFGYDAGQSARTQRRGLMTVNWLLDEYGDPQTQMELDILSYLLLGSQAAPLRKALLDSGLGEEVTGGFNGGMRQMMYSAGMKGIAPADAGKVETLILDTLGALVKDGFASELLESALNTLEFRLRENNTGSFPRGLSLMFRALNGWLYGHDPIDGIAFDVPLQAVKQHVVAEPALFQTLINRHLLTNLHRVTVVLSPDPDLRSREEAAEQKRLATISAGLTDDARRALVETTEALKRLQETPDTPEALATVPMLKLSDLDRTGKTIPLALASSHGSTVLTHDLFTNGIAYLDIAFDMRAMPPSLVPYLSLFGRALLEMGTTREDYVQMSMRIGRKTGGLSRSSLTTLRQDNGALSSWFVLRGKATMPQVPDLLAIVRDILLDSRLDNRDRFKQIVLQEKAREEAALVPSGHAFAGSRMRAAFNTADWAREQMGGVAYIFFLRALAEQVDSDWPAVLAALEGVRSALLNRRSMLWNVTLDADNLQRFEPQLAGLIQAMPAGPITYRAWPISSVAVNEGLAAASKVNYVAKGDNLYKYGYKPTGATMVATRLLSIGYLHDKLRVQGGAYGGGCSFDRNTGVFSYTSYRDPNLLGTLDNYDSAPQFLRASEITADELHKNIIGLIGQLDFYQLPDAKGYTSMARHLTGVTEESRQQTRQEILAATVAEVRTLADALDEVKRNGTVVVLGSAEAIAKANAERANWLTVTDVS